MGREEKTERDSERERELLYEYVARLSFDTGMRNIAINLFTAVKALLGYA